MSISAPKGWAFALTIGLLVSASLVCQAQQVESIPLPGYRPPTRAQWLDAGLDLDEYNTALRYEVSLEEWKAMNTSRHTHLTAGWACIGTALLGTAVGGTVYYATNVDFSAHPEQEVTIVAAVAAGALLLTGIVLASTAPGPEDFRRSWFMKQGGQAAGQDKGQWLANLSGLTLRW